MSEASARVKDLDDLFPYGVDAKAPIHEGQLVVSRALFGAAGPAVYQTESFAESQPALMTARQAIKLVTERYNRGLTDY